MFVVRRELPAPARDVVTQRPARVVLHVPRGDHQHAKRGLGVRHHTELGRIVAPDLCGIGVDVDEPRWRNGEREPRIPRARVRLRQPRANGKNQIGVAARVVRDRQAPESCLAQQQRMPLVQAALPHKRMCDRHFQRFGQRRQLGRRARGQHASTGIDHRTLRRGERLDDRSGRRRIERGPGERGRRFLKRAHRQIGGKDVHGHVHQHRTGTARLAEVERALQDPRQILGPVDPVHALAERPVDLHLAGVVMEVHFLMRVTAVKVRLDVAGDHDHRNGIERGVCHAGRGIREARPEMRQHHARLTGDARVAVCGVRGDLLVPGRHKPHPALAERIQHADHGVAAEPEHDLHADLFQVLGHLVGGDARACGRDWRGHSGLTKCTHDAPVLATRSTGQPPVTAPPGCLRT